MVVPRPTGGGQGEAGSSRLEPLNLPRKERPRGESAPNEAGEYSHVLKVVADAARDSAHDDLRPASCDQHVLLDEPAAN
jgi:hypothetical protein